MLSFAGSGQHFILQCTCHSLRRRQITSLAWHDRSFGSTFLTHPGALMQVLGHAAFYWMLRVCAVSTLCVVKGSSCLMPYENARPLPASVEDEACEACPSPGLCPPSIYSPFQSLKHTFKVSLFCGYEIAASGSFPMKNNPGPEGFLGT